MTVWLFSLQIDQIFDSRISREEALLCYSCYFCIFWPRPLCQVPLPDNVQLQQQNCQPADPPAENRTKPAEKQIDAHLWTIVAFQASSVLSEYPNRVSRKIALRRISELWNCIPILRSLRENRWQTSSQTALHSTGMAIVSASLRHNIYNIHTDSNEKNKPKFHHPQNLSNTPFSGPSF